MNAHKPKAGFGLFSVKKVATTVGWTIGFAALTMLFIWVIRAIAPQPQPAAIGTPTTVSNEAATPISEDVGGYDFRGGKIFLPQPLPESPATANVYMLKEDAPATIDDALALASRFGIEGEVYAAAGRMPDTTEYAISDGKQWLSVSTKNYFFYTSDMLKNSRGFSGRPNDNAEAIIRVFLTSHGFDFQFSVVPSDMYSGYIIQPLAPDGLPMQYEFNSTPIMRVVLDENGEVLSLDTNLAVYDQTPLGSYGIISAEEAMQILLDDSITTGKIESMHSGNGTPPQQWYRQYPDGEQVTIYGPLTIAPAVDSSKPALLLIDSVPAIGNTSGLESLDNYQYVKANGKYISDNGVHKFTVDSWESKNVTLGFYSGTLRREGDQTILTSDDGSGTEYPMIDPPADVPLNTKSPESQLFVYGVIADGKIDWTYIQYFADSSQMGGGGGGGGLGFHKLNLSGTPVPFPTPTQMPIPPVDANSLHYIVQEGDTLARIASLYGLTAEQLQQANGLNDANIMIGQSLAIPGTTAPPKLEGARGTVGITILISEDGSQRAQYYFSSSNPQDPYMMLEGDNLEELQAYQNKPIKIWGTSDRLSEFGTPMIAVEKFEVLFPDLQFQILKGVEKAIQLEGTDVLLFTAEDGKQYVEFAPNCSETLIGSGDKADEGATIMVEALAVPDMAFGGYPVICVFSTGLASDANGNPVEMSISADQPNIIPEMSIGPFSQPKITIDSVELVYVASNPNYQIFDPAAAERSSHIQPVWHFHGFYESGEEVDIMVQALKRDFLLPELETYIGPG
jgi:LysM repeat protein